MLKEDTKISTIVNSVNLEKDFVILDVDRTIINTTSWYHACKCPDLLISQSNINKFLEMNDEAFLKGDIKSLEKFRNRTLELVENKITNEFKEKIGQLFSISRYFAEGDYTSHLRFYAAGLYVSYNLVKVYDDAIKFIEFCSRYYGSNLKIVFLSAGYGSFIKGVIDGIFAKNSLGQIDYSVVGSELEIVNGISQEIFHMNQFKKEVVIRELISAGAKIRFLADDSDENKNLLTAVQEHGGTVLKVRHIHNQVESKSWNDFSKLFTHQNIKNILKKNDTFLSSNNESIDLPELLYKISNDTNEIGIARISLADFTKGIKSLTNIFSLESNKTLFSEIINEMVFIKEESVYLRGEIYYNWLPPYIFPYQNTINERWQDLMKKSTDLFEVIVKEGVFLNIDQLTYVEKLIIYSIIDHLLEGIFYILNLTEQYSLKANDEESFLCVNDVEKIVCIAEKVSDLFYLYISNNDVKNISIEIMNNLKEFEITRKIPKYTKLYKYNRELDNNISIYNSIRYIAKESKSNNMNFDYVIAFPYGGISLGLAFKSFIKIYYDAATAPEVINCHYSSKQKLREKVIENQREFNIFDYIPKEYNNAIHKIKQGKCNILLLDNNVTTFKTLELCKIFLEKLGNNVYSAVSAVNYDNICDYLLDQPNYEHLSPNWRKILSFTPTDEYITAFNTWKTSGKSRLLEQVYFDESPRKLIYSAPEIIEKQYILKSCRVHNLYDLNVSISNGYNMIGIHAVYPDRINYLMNELKYEPLQNNVGIFDELPVALLEIDSIRVMQKYIPDNIKQAIIFEKAIDLELARKCCELYSMPKDSMYIQLQYRTNTESIKNIKSKLCKKIIVAVGLFQHDFAEYFWNIHNILNPETDYILLDCSRHQPDFIAGSGSYDENADKVFVLEKLAKLMANNEIPIIIADDTSVEVMKNYLDVIKLHNIKIKGIDMQNSVEIKTNEQRYQIFKSEEHIYHGKIRKSGTLMGEWSEFFKTINTNIFV